MMSGEERCGQEEKESKTEADSVNVDPRLKGLSDEETQNQAEWRQLVRSIDPT